MRGWVVLGLVLWVAVLRAPYLFVDPFGWDEGFYMIAGQRLLAGDHLYADIWDYKPVGIFLIYAAILLVLGKTVTAIVVASALAVFSTALLLLGIANRGFERPRGGIYAAILFAAYMVVGEGTGANAENFFIVFGTLSMLLLSSHLRRPAGMAAHRKVAFAFGLIQGLALQIKFLTAPETVFLGLVFGVVVLSERRRLLDGVELFACFIVPFLLPTLIVFAYFWQIGAFGEMFMANFISPAYYAKSPFGLKEPLDALRMIASASRGYFPLFLAGGASFLFLAVAVWRRPGRESVPYYLATAWLLGAVFSSTYTGQFFDHYFIVLAAPLSLFAGLAIDRLGRASGSAWALRAAAVAVLVAFPLSSEISDIRKRMREPFLNPSHAIADEVKRLVPPGSPIYVLNLTPEIYFLSDTIPTGRFSFSWQISEERFVPFGIDVPTELQRTFAPKPLLVVVQPDYLAGQPTGIASLFQEYIKRDYQEVAIADQALRERVLIFRRRSDRP